MRLPTVLLHIFRTVAICAILTPSRTHAALIKLSTDEKQNVTCDGRHNAVRGGATK